MICNSILCNISFAHFLIFYYLHWDTFFSHNAEVGVHCHSQYFRRSFAAVVIWHRRLWYILSLVTRLLLAHTCNAHGDLWLSSPQKHGYTWGYFLAKQAMADGDWTSRLFYAVRLWCRVSTVVVIRYESEVIRYPAISKTALPDVRAINVSLIEGRARELYRHSSSNASKSQSRKWNCFSALLCLPCVLWYSQKHKHCCMMVSVAHQGSSVGHC